MDSEGKNSMNIPVMDLRCFCQDELLVAAELSGHFPEAWFPNLIIPALDKNFFNTSLASRKQTYRRRPRRPRAEPSSSASSAQAAAPRQSRPLPKARLLLENKKTKQTLKPNLKKNQKNPQSTSPKQRSEKSVADTESLILKNDLNSHLINSQSGRPDADADALLEPSRQMESRTITSEATDQSHGQALQPTAKRMRLKDGARNRSMVKKQGGYSTLHCNASEGAANALQVSSTECLDHNPSSYFQDLQNPKRVLEIAMEGGLESCKKEEMELDVVVGVAGETATFDYLSKVEDPWISRHMEKKTLVARRFVTGWEVTDCFRRSSGLDELEFSNHERRDFRWTNQLV